MGGEVIWVLLHGGRVKTFVRYLFSKILRNSRVRRTISECALSVDCCVEMQEVGRQQGGSTCKFIKSFTTKNQNQYLLFATLNPTQVTLRSLFSQRQIRNVKELKGPISNLLVFHLKAISLFSAVLQCSTSINIHFCSFSRFIVLIRLKFVKCR